MTMEELRTVSDEQLINILTLIKEEQQRRKDKEIANAKEVFTRKINDLINLAARMETSGIGIELEFANDFECRAYRLPDENLDITAHVFHIYKDGE